MQDLSRKKLQDIYENNKLEKAAKMLEMSIPTLLKYVKEAGIPLKSRNGKKLPKFRII